MSISYYQAHLETGNNYKQQGTQMATNGHSEKVIDL